MKTTITRHKHVICPLCQGNGTITKYTEQQATTTTINVQRERMIYQCKACEGKGILIQIETETNDDTPTVHIPFNQPYPAPTPSTWEYPYAINCTNASSKPIFPFDVFFKMHDDKKSN